MRNYVHDSESYCKLCLCVRTSAVSFTHARGHDSPQEPSTLSAIKPDRQSPPTFVPTRLQTAHVIQT